MPFTDPHFQLPRCLSILLFFTYQHRFLSQSLFPFSSIQMRIRSVFCLFCRCVCRNYRRKGFCSLLIPNYFNRFLFRDMETVDDSRNGNLSILIFILLGSMRKLRIPQREQQKKKKVLSISSSFIVKQAMISIIKCMENSFLYIIDGQDYRLGIISRFIENCINAAEICCLNILAIILIPLCRRFL